MNRALKFALALCLSLVLISCSTTPVTGKKAFTIYSEREENRQGVEAYHDILSKERETSNYTLAAMVSNIGKRIAIASGKSDFQWEFKTIESPEANAFCLPGGKVAVYTGIMKYAKNEAGLAAVMGHEVAHALARHGGQRMSQHMAMNVGMAALGITALSKMDDTKKSLVMAALGAATTVGVMLPFSRSHEKEADEIGLVLMAKAGYDPREAVNFWDRFSKAGGKSPPEFLSTHPGSGKRRDHLSSKLPAVMPLYQNAPEQFGLGQEL